MSGFENVSAPGSAAGWKAEMESRCLLADDNSIQERKLFIPLHPSSRERGREGDRVMPWFLQTDKGMRRHTLMHVKIFVPLLMVLSRLLKALLLTVQRETHVVSSTFFHSPVFLFVSVVSLV